MTLLARLSLPPRVQGTSTKRGLDLAKPNQRTQSTRERERENKKTKRRIALQLKLISKRMGLLYDHQQRILYKNFTSHSNATGCPGRPDPLCLGCSRTQATVLVGSSPNSTLAKVVFTTTVLFVIILSLSESSQRRFPSPFILFWCVFSLQSHSFIQNVWWQSHKVRQMMILRSRRFLAAGAGSSQRTPKDVVLKGHSHTVIYIYIYMCSFYSSAWIKNII